MADLLRVGADRVGDLLMADLLRVGADRVGDLLVANLLRAAADRVGDLLVADLLRVAADGIRLFVRRGAGNLTANRVGDLAVLHFRLVPRGADFLLNGFFNPDAAAAGLRRALYFHQVAAARAIQAAAAARIPFPVARIALALFHLAARNRLRHRLPLAAANGDHFLLDDRPADGVALVAVAGLLLGLVRRAADVAGAGLVAGLADRVADVFVARLVRRTAHRVADVFPARRAAGLADRVADVLVASLVMPVADGVADVLVAGLEAGLAHREAAVFIARLKDVAGAAERDLLADVIVHRLAADVALLLPDRLVDSLVRGGRRRGAARLGGGVIAARRARFRGAARVAPKYSGDGAATRLGERARQ